MSHPHLLAATGMIGFLMMHSSAVAKLDLVTLEDLLKESSLIVLAQASEAKVGEYGRGHAILTIVRVVRGHASSATIRIESAGREDEHAIRTVGQEYLLFLRYRDGKFEAAIRGLSYWPVMIGFDAKQVVEYVYPTNMVVVPEDLVTNVQPPPGLRGACAIEVIPLERLIPRLQAERAEPANNRLKLPARGRSAAAWRLSTRAAA